MSIVLKDIQNFNGNFYELITAIIIRIKQITETVSDQGDTIIYEDRIISEAFNDLLQGKYTYKIE